jgi:hypothetical protein
MRPSAEVGSRSDILEGWMSNRKKQAALINFNFSEMNVLLRAMGKVIPSHAAFIRADSSEIGRVKVRSELTQSIRTHSPFLPQSYSYSGWRKQLGLSNTLYLFFRMEEEVSVHYRVYTYIHTYVLICMCVYIGIGGGGPSPAFRSIPSLPKIYWTRLLTSR